MSLAAVGDSPITSVSASTSNQPPATAPTAAPTSGAAPTAAPLTEAQALDEFQKLDNTDAVYAKAQQLIAQAQSDAAKQAIQDAFDARIAAPAAKDIADAYRKGGAMAGAASLLKALKAVPPDVAASIFDAAKPTVDAISQELGGTAFASQFLLPPSTSGSVTSLRKRQQDGIPQAYPPQLWKIASQDEFKSVYADLSAAVELASKGPQGNAAAKQVADAIVTALPYQAKDAVYLPSPENVDTNALMSGAVTQTVSNGDGAALSLALVKRASEVPAPSAASSGSGVLAPPPRLDTKRLFDAIGAGVKTLQTNNDNATTDFLTPAPELAQLAMRWGGLAGDDPAGIAKVQQALAKTIDQTPSLAKPLQAKQEKVDQTAGDVAGALIDLQNASSDLQGVAGFDSLASVTLNVQKDKQTSSSFGVSATAQAAITDAQLRELAASNPTFNAHGKPPNLLWASRIARGLVAEIAAMKIDAKPGDQLNAAMANFSRLKAYDGTPLFSPSDLTALKQSLSAADLNVQADAVASAAKAVADTGMTPITARGGFAPSTPMGKAMTGLGTGLYLLGAWDLINTPILPGQNPVPAHINQAFGYYVLWGAVNNGYMNASSWAQTLLVGENSTLFKDKMPIGGVLDRMTRPAVGRGTLYEASGDAFDAGASVLLGGIAGYEFSHKQYINAGFHLSMSLVGGYPVGMKYGSKIPSWLAGGPEEAIAGDALEESLAAGAAAEGGGAALGGPLSTIGMLALVTGQYFYKTYTNESQAAKMEPFNRTFLRNFGYTRSQAKLLANDDQYGNSIGPTLQAVAYRLGISSKQMGQYLTSFTDMDKLNQLVLATQNVDADAQGNYRLTLLDHDDAFPDAPAGLSPQALRSFYMNQTKLYDVSTVLAPAYSQDAQPPLNADDRYYRQLALKRETPHSIDGLIQWAEDDGIPFPTGNTKTGGGGTPAPAPTSGATPTPASTPAPTPSSGPKPMPSSGPAPTPTPTPTSGSTPPSTPEPRDPHGPGGQPRTPVPTPTERDVAVQPGDTMTGIAQSDGATLPELAPLNPSFDWALLGIDAPIQGPRDPDWLFPGDIIHVPIRP